MQLKWPMRWDLFSLFPAYAGVILEAGSAFDHGATFPRIRGGDPDLRRAVQHDEPFSPHTRG